MTTSSFWYQISIVALASLGFMSQVGLGETQSLAKLPVDLDELRTKLQIVHEADEGWHLFVYSPMMGEEEESQKISALYLAYTVINPGPVVGYESDLFGDDPNQPLPYKKARQVCQSKNDFGLKWALPNSTETRIITMKYKIDNSPMNIADEHPLVENFQRHHTKGGQFKTFWLRTIAKKPVKGTKMAGSIYSQTAGLVSEHSPRSYYCVATIRTVKDGTVAGGPKEQDKG